VLFLVRRHCEERSDEAIQAGFLDCFAEFIIGPAKPDLVAPQ